MRRTVLTHAHIDHVGGTKAFPTRRRLRLAGRRATRSTSPMPIDGYKAFMPAFDEEFDDLAELGTRRSRTWSTAPRSSRRASSCSRPSGHTAGDLHRARRRRRRVLRRRPLLLRRHAARVPGRPRGVGRHARRGRRARRRDRARARSGRRRAPRCASCRRYLRTCVAANGDVTAIAAGPWDTWIDRDRDAINVERAALLAARRRRASRRRCSRPSVRADVDTARWRLAATR